MARRRKRSDSSLPYDSRSSETRILKYDSWTDFINQSADGPSEIPDYQRSSKEGREWQGGSFDTAVSLARKGWAEGVERAKPLLDRLETKIGGQIPIQQIQYDLTGDLLDIGRYCNGEPEHWGTFVDDYMQVQQIAKIKCLHVVVNVSVNGGTSPEAMIAKGAAVAAYVCLLERAQIRVKVTAAFGSRSGGARCYIYIPVKEYDEYLDVDKLVYAVAHPSVLRVHCFSVLEQLEADARQRHGVTDGGYGSATDVEERGDVYIGATDFLGGDDAEEWITEQLRKQGAIEAAV